MYILLLYYWYCIHHNIAWQSGLLLSNIHAWHKWHYIELHQSQTFLAQHQSLVSLILLTSPYSFWALFIRIHLKLLLYYFPYITLLRFSFISLKVVRKGKYIYVLDSLQAQCPLNQDNKFVALEEENRKLLKPLQKLVIEKAQQHDDLLHQLKPTLQAL